MSKFKKTLLLIILIIIPILSGEIYSLTGALIGISISLLICILLIIINADKLVLRLYRARLAQAGELPEMREKIQMLSARYGVQIPRIYVTEIEFPGSFVIGRNPKNTSILVPKRLCDILKGDELEAVFAHNIVQIDETIRRRTIVALLSSVLTMSSSAVRWGAVFTGFGDFNDPAPKLFGSFVMGLAAPPAAALIHSVSNEDYDSKAAMLCKNPGALISAIEHLESNNVTAYPSLGFLCLIDPLKETFFESLLNVHPPKEIRKENLTGHKI